METEQIYKYLPERITSQICRIPSDKIAACTEIRLRRGGLLSMTSSGANITTGYVCTAADIEETVGYLTAHSLYAYGSAIRNGYIPLAGGARAGVCGDAVGENGEISSFGEITSVSVRIPRNFPESASGLYKLFRSDGLAGTLIYSPPGGGKTTYLKSIISLVSKHWRVGVADERYELSSAGGQLADYVTGCRKSQALNLLIRTMSPQVVVCDEISADEAEGVTAAQNSGIALIATCHAYDHGELMKKDYIAQMIKRGIFKYGVRLWYDNGYKSEVSPL